MYYVDNECERYRITTSYATKYQAEKYGGVARVGELHLFEGDGCSFVDQLDEVYLENCEDLGRIRTIFSGREDGLAAGRYMIYYNDIDEDNRDHWKFSGISFQEYGDANRFLKTKSLVFYGDLTVVENPDVGQAFDARGKEFSIDLENPIHKASLNIYED